MRSREERRLYKQYRYQLKQINATLKYKHGIYTLKWTQREGPLIVLDLYVYTLTDTNLNDILERYAEIKSKEHY